MKTVLLLIQRKSHTFFLVCSNTFIYKEDQIPIPQKIFYSNYSKLLQYNPTRRIKHRSPQSITVTLIYYTATIITFTVTTDTIFELLVPHFPLL